jgi:hypothetical protein
VDEFEALVFDQVNLVRDVERGERWLASESAGGDPRVIHRPWDVRAARCEPGSRPNRNPKTLKLDVGRRHRQLLDSGDRPSIFG